MAPSSVPLIPRHAPDDMMLRLQLLRDEAEAEAAGQGTLAYLIDLARMEARRLSERARLDAVESGMDRHRR